MLDMMGMRFFSTDDADTVRATMPVNSHTCHPYGGLSGGASIALAETLAGLGSCAICPGMECLGIEVSASHVRAAFEGETVVATARIVHRGKTIHRWNVDITSEEGRLVSNVRVTNLIVKSNKAWPTLSTDCPSPTDAS